METIDKIEKSLTEERDVQQAFTEFVEIIKVEMDAKLPNGNNIRQMLGISHTYQDQNHTGHLNYRVCGRKFVNGNVYYLQASSV